MTHYIPETVLQASKACKFTSGKIKLTKYCFPQKANNENKLLRKYSTLTSSQRFSRFEEIQLSYDMILIK
jgi:hypothetical protein